MSVVFHADGADIEIDKIRWRLYDTTTGHVSAQFMYTRGDRVVYYTSRLGSRLGLPGDRFSIEYIRAVLVGYQERFGCWVLGFHVASSGDEKPRFIELVRWPAAESHIHVQEVRDAARALGTFLSCPLKVFGEKKLPSRSQDPARSGFTGPLTPHSRERIEPEEVHRIALQVELPVEDDSFIMNSGRNGLILKLKQRPKAEDAESPIFNLCEVNFDKQTIRLVPPTGLLGAFTSSPAGTREIPFAGLYNVEFRYIKEEITEAGPAEKEGYQQVQLTVRHIWGVYLTIQKESLLIVQTAFTQSSELMQSRIDTVGGGKLDTDLIRGLQYFREHMEEQEIMDTHRQNTENVAYLIANPVRCPVIKTEVET